MKSNFKLSAILLCLVVAGCMETGQQQLTENKSFTNSVASDESDPNARKGDGGSTTGQIYLSVTVDDLMISSDGIGAYVNGVDGVSAQFVSPDGTFSFGTSTARIKNPRRLTFPANNPTYAINPNLSPNYVINVLANEYDPAPYKIQDIPVNESQVMAMRVYGVNSRGIIDFRFLFNLGIGAGYITDKVTVTRIDTTTWTVESTSDATAALTGGNNKDFKAYYSVPFKLTLKTIN